jgi:hypothetical protein
MSDDGLQWILNASPGVRFQPHEFDYAVGKTVTYSIPTFGVEQEARIARVDVDDDGQRAVFVMSQEGRVRVVAQAVIDEMNVSDDSIHAQGHLVTSFEMERSLWS